MRKKLRVYTPFLRSGISTMLAYRVNFTAFFIGNIFYCFIMYFLWLAVFRSNLSADFMGFTMTDMVVFLFITNLTSYLNRSNATGSVAEQIRDGSFCMNMIKPVKFDFVFLFTELGQSVVTVSLLLLPMVFGVELYRYFAVGKVMFNLAYFLLYLVSVSLSYLLSFYLSLCIGFLAFFLKNLWGFTILKDSIISFLSGAVIPIAFMPVWAQNILNWLPFSSISYTPVMIYMGRYAPLKIAGSLAIQVFWVAAFWVFSKLIWRASMKYVTVQGG